MQTRVLVAYSSNSGSTAEVAEAIGKELGQDGAQVDVHLIRDLGDAPDLSSYSAVVIGGPMILGWHREAARFVRNQRLALSRLPVAYFVTAMSLTDAEAAAPDGVAVYKDPRLVKTPKTPHKLTLKERYASVGNYLRPILGNAPEARPVSVAFFGGKLDFGRLNFLQMLFVMLIIGAQPGDYRNWDAIRNWAGDLRSQLLCP
jgi:menaquinone-dependent protoporphyrinogen oxidase